MSRAAPLSAFAQRVYGPPKLAGGHDLEPFRNRPRRAGTGSSLRVEMASSLHPLHRGSPSDHLCSIRLTMDNSSVVRSPARATTRARNRARTPPPPAAAHAAGFGASARSPASRDARRSRSARRTASHPRPRRRARHAIAAFSFRSVSRAPGVQPAALAPSHASDSSARLIRCFGIKCACTSRPSHSPLPGRFAATQQPRLTPTAPGRRIARSAARACPAADTGVAHARLIPAAALGHLDFRTAHCHAIGTHT
jgi:hypothetical protein